MSNARLLRYVLIPFTVMLVACGDDDDSGGTDAGNDASTEAVVAVANILNTSSGGGENTLAGTATFEQEGSTVTLTVTLTNCPAGEHGFHIHQNDSCADTTPDGGTAVPAGGAGPHWAVANPGAAGHGSHIGDIGNITCASDGTASRTVTRTDWTVHEQDPDTDVVGHALIVHQNMDTEQPGDEGMASSGGRIGCGRILTNHQ